jgi:5-methyltetrahydrofolate--homocysteine methyltransferase
MMTAYRAYRALTGRDHSCSEWVDGASRLVTLDAAQSSVGTSIATAGAVSSGEVDLLATAIRRGLKADAAEAARARLAAGSSAIEIIDGGIVPALEEVGKGFEEKRVFLPQLLMAADAAGAAFEVVRGALAHLDEAEVKGPIVIATVKGDVHDIGKNIVRALLENYGFKVIDLGRDVEPERILEAAERTHCKLIGLSALMTTTVKFMEETIALIHAKLPDCRIMVGGAVLTEDYAKQIGADFYSKDAMGAVRTAESLF